MRLVRDEREQYQNSIETEIAIRHAFLNLMKTKDLDKISIADIAKGARIERSTFYSHYQNIYYLVMDISKVQFDEIRNVLVSNGDDILASLPAAVWHLITTINDFPYGVIIRSKYWLPFSFAISWGVLNVLATDKLIADDQEMLDRKKIQLDHFWSGVMYTLHGWINSRFKCSEEDLIAVLTETALQFVQIIRNENSK